MLTSKQLTSALWKISNDSNFRGKQSSKFIGNIDSEYVTTIVRNVGNYCINQTTGSSVAQVVKLQHFKHICGKEEIFFYFSVPTAWYHTTDSAWRYIKCCRGKRDLSYCTRIYSCLHFDILKHTHTHKLRYLKRWDISLHFIETLCIYLLTCTPGFLFRRGNDRTVHALSCLTRSIWVPTTDRINVQTANSGPNYERLICKGKTYRYKEELVSSEKNR
jgi:hypothetical protein